MKIFNMRNFLLLKMYFRISRYVIIILLLYSNIIILIILF